MKKNVLNPQQDRVHKIVENLRSQIILTIDKIGDDFDSLFSLNPYSLGYIYGFCNGSFVFHQIQQELEKFKFLTQVYSQLFSEAGSDIFQSTLNINEEGHPQFQEGTVSGFEEYLRWHYRKEQPVGLMRYTLRGEKTKTLAPHLIKY